MKIFGKQFFRMAGMFTLVLTVLAFSSCKKEEPAPDPIASFQFEVSEANYLEVTFTNYSTNAETYSWDFGDGGTSTEMSPVYTYTEAGNYEVVLTAANVDGKTATFSSNIELTDPLEAQTLLDGGSSKTWKLWRGEGFALGVGPDPENTYSWWALANDGTRPCVFYDAFTFNRDGSFVYDDAGTFWGEVAVFEGTDFNEICFDAVPGNMINKDGADVSAWLGGTHQFTYDPTVGEITLTGLGAWMGMPQLGDVETSVPDAQRTFKATLQEMEGYDMLTIEIVYEWGMWTFNYASYHNPDDEPEVVTVNTWGEDLDDVTPTEMFNTFASTDEADVKNLAPTESSVVLTVGVDDPADASAAKVGEFVRGTADPYSDLKFKMDYDIQFDNFTTMSIDVYFPSSNAYTDDGLKKEMSIWIADMSQTQEFWGSWVQFVLDPEKMEADKWITFTFDLATPSDGSTGTPKDRTDLDLVGISFGGGGHNADGTIYLRNFKFE